MEVRVVSEDRKQEFRKLLLLAEDSEVQIDIFINQGTMLELVVDGKDGIGVIILLENEQEVEIKYLAITEELQCKGYGSKFLQLLDEYVKTNLPHITKIILLTAPSCGRRVEFYQRAGFRPFKVERDYFAPEKGYCPPNNQLYFEENGILIRDALWFDKELNKID